MASLIPQVERLAELLHKTAPQSEVKENERRDALKQYCLVPTLRVESDKHGLPGN